MQIKLILLLIFLIILIGCFYLIRTDTEPGRGLRNIVEQARNYFKSLWQGFWNWLKDVVWEYVQPWFKNRAEAIKRGLNEERKELQDNIKKSIEKGIDKAWSAIKGLFNGDEINPATSTPSS